MSINKFFTKKRRGAITIFMVIIYMSVFVLEALLVDFSRLHIAEAEAEQAQQMANESIMAQFNEVLYQYYDLFGQSEFNQSKPEDQMKSMIQMQMGAHGKNIQNTYKRIDPIYRLSKWNTGKVFDPFDYKIESLKVGSNGNLAESEILRSQLADSMRYKGIVYMAEYFFDVLSNVGNMKAVSDTVKTCTDAITDVYNPYGQLYQMTIHLQQNIDEFLEKPDEDLSGDFTRFPNADSKDTYTNQSTGKSPDVVVKSLVNDLESLSSDIDSAELDYKGGLDDINKAINADKTTLEDDAEDLDEDDIKDIMDDIASLKHQKDGLKTSYLNIVDEKTQEFITKIENVNNNIDLILQEMDELDTKIAEVNSKAGEASGKIEGSKSNENNIGENSKAVSNEKVKGSPTAIADGFQKNITKMTGRTEALKNLLDEYRTAFKDIQEISPNKSDVEAYVSSMKATCEDQASDYLDYSNETRFTDHYARTIDDEQKENFYKNQKHPEWEEILDECPQAEEADNDSEEGDDEDDDEKEPYYHVFLHLKVEGYFCQLSDKNEAAYRYCILLKSKMTEIKDKSKLPDSYYENNDREQKELKSRKDADNLDGKEIDPNKPETSKAEITSSDSMSNSDVTGKIPQKSESDLNSLKSGEAKNGHKFGTINPHAQADKDNVNGGSSDEAKFGEATSKSAKDTKSQNEKTLTDMSEKAENMLSGGFKSLLECTYIMSNLRDSVHLNHMTSDNLKRENNTEEYDYAMNKKFIDGVDMSKSYYLSADGFKNIEVTCAEQEYIIFGKPNTKDDIENAYMSIFMMRLALDYVSVWCTPETRDAVLEAVSGLAVTGPLAIVAMAALPLVFSVPRAAADMGLIMTAKKTPLVYLESDDWAYAGAKQDDSDSLMLVGYSDYLMLLLIMDFGDKHTGRLMDVIETNMRNLPNGDYKDFTLKDSVVEAHADLESSINYLFAGQAFIPSEFRQNGRWKFKTNTAFSY